MPEWKEISADVLGMAAGLVEKYHPDLKDANIGFVFRSEAGASQGKKVLAKAMRPDRKLTPYMKQELDFLIWISIHDWAELSDMQRMALLDHELCHCMVDSDGRRSLRGHDIEDFSAIIERYGLWNADLFKAGPNLQRAVQLALFPDLPGAMFTGTGQMLAVDPDLAIPNEAS